MLGEDNRLSILIQAKIDEASTQTMQKQLDTLSKNLKAVKISLDLGDVEGKFIKLTKEIQKEASKVAIDKKQGEGFKGTLEESIGHIKKLGSEMDHIFDKMRSLGNIKSLNEVFDDKGNITGYKVQVEEMVDGFKILQNYNVMGSLVEDTKQWEYAITKAGSKIVEVNKLLNTTGDSEAFAKSINSTLEKQKQSVISLEEAYERLSKQMRYEGGKGDYNKHVGKLPQNVQQEVIASYEQLQKSIVDKQKKAQSEMDKLHEQALKEDYKRTQQAKDSEAKIEEWKLQKEWLLAKDAHEKKKALDEKQAKEKEALREKETQAIEAQIKAEEEAQRKLGETWAKDIKREQDVADKKEKVMKRINSLQDSGLKFDSGSLEKLAKELGNVDYRSVDADRSIRKINDSVNTLERQAKQSAKQVNGLGDVLKKSFAMFSLYDAMQLGKQTIREMIEQVVLLDDALIELQKVSDLSGDGLDRFADKAFKISEKVGQLGSSVVQSSADFKKMGYTVEEALSLAETAMVYTNVGDNVSTEDATKTLISTMKAFNIEAKDSINIIDKINGVSNNFAISSEGLGDALTRSASALYEANNSLDQTLALYAVANETVQNPESISTGLRTISMRLRGLDEESGKLIPKFRQMFLEYTDGRVDIMNTNDEFKSTFEIIKDLGQEWQNLTDVQRANLAELTAGKQRANIFMALMRSAEDLDKAVETSMNSMGSALEENDRAMDSITGRMNQLKSAIQQLSINTFSSEFVKSITSMLTSLVKLVDQIGVVNIALIALGTYMAFSKNSAIVAMVNNLASAFVGLGLKIGSATIAQIGMNTAMTAFVPVAIIGAILGLVKAFDFFIVSAEEQRQKVEELKVEYQNLTGEIETLKNISNPSQGELQRLKLLEMEAEATRRLIDENNKLLLQKEAFGRGDFNPFEDGLVGDSESKLEYVKTILGDIASLEEEMSQMKTDGSSDEAIKKKADHITYLRNELTTAVPELIQLKTKLEEFSKVAEGDDKTEIDNMIQSISDGLQTLDDILGLTTKAVEDNASSMRDHSLIMEDFRAEEEATKEVLSKTMDEYIELTDVIKRLTEGKALSLQEAKNIAEQYGLEYSSIIQVADGYGIELDELLNLKNNKLSSLNAMSGAENQHKNEAIESIKARIKAIGHEIDAYGDLLVAKQKVLGTLNTLEINRNKEFQDPFGLDKNNPFSSKMNQAKNDLADKLIQQNKEELAIIQGGIDDWNEVMKSNQEREDAVDRLTGGYTGSLNSNEKKKEPKKGKSQSYISQNLDVLIDDVLRKGDELAKAVEFTNAKLDNAIAKGDEKTELTLKEQLVTSMQERVKATEQMAKDLRAQGEKMVSILGSTGLFKGKDLKNLTEKELADVVRTIDVKLTSSTDEQSESLNLLKGKIQEYGNAIIRIYQDELPALSQAWWDLENERIAQTIALIDERYEREDKKRDDALRAIELEQILTQEGTEKYINLEKKKYELLLQEQESANQALREMKEKNISMESADAQRYLNIWYDAEREKRNMLKQFAEEQQKLQKEKLELQKTELDEGKKALETLLDMTMKMIKEEANAKKKALKEELDGYKKIIDAKKESLKEEKDERDHQKNLKEKQDAIKKVEDKILELSNDNSAKAQAEKKRLEEELLKLKEDLTDYQYDHSLEKQEEALDKEYDAFEENINKELNKIEDFLDKEGNLRAEAIKLIEQKNKALYEKLLQWNKDYGTGVDADVTNAWDKAYKAMDTFNDGQINVLNTLQNITNEVKRLNTELKTMNSLTGITIPDDWLGQGGVQDNPDGSTNKPQGDEYQKLIDEIAPQMNRNSKAWLETEDKAERDRLAKENERLAKKIGARKDKDGDWFVVSNHKYVKLKDLYPEYHTGGVVGGQPNLKSTEEFAKLLKGEVVVTEQQMAKFMSKTLPTVATGNQKAGVDLSIDRFIDITVQGNLDNSVDIEAIIKRASQKAIDSLVNTLSNKGIKQRVGFY